MAEELIIDKQAGKAGKYQELMPQLEALVKNEGDVIANMANISAALWQTFHFFWVGFYRVVEGELVLGPFKVQSLVRVSGWAGVFVVLPGKKARHLSCRMWISFRDILLVIRPLVRRSWYLFGIKRVRL